MKSSDKIRVGVLYGGRSAEHEVSIRSAESIMRHLDPTLFDVIPIGIDHNGKWYFGKKIFNLSHASKTIPNDLSPSSIWFSPKWVSQFNGSQPVPSTNCLPNESVVDVIFPAIHGVNCEDGTLQGILEQANIPYVGCNVIASAIGMDKDISKRLVEHAGINIVPYFTITEFEWVTQQDFVKQKITAELQYPLFIKPKNTGSSIGISRVKNEAELNEAIQTALQYDNKIIIEKALDIQELEVAVLEALEVGSVPLVSIAGEIRPTSDEFYSYEAKYIDPDGAELLIPANISLDAQAEVQRVAQVVFSTLLCEGMARVDLFLEKSSGKIYFNEINTLPGFTSISMYPKLIAATHMGYTQLLSHLIQLAISRHRQRSKFIVNYVVKDYCCN